MTLQEWCDTNNISPTHPTTERGAVSVMPDNRGESRYDLWHLNDYIVSAASYAVVWLVPRE